MPEQFKLNRKWLGMVGVPPHDHPRAYTWEKRLHGVMLGFALLAIFAFYLTEVEPLPRLRAAGHLLEWLVFGGFSAELAIMLTVTRQKLPTSWATGSMC
jgi:hypothetical protein